jgi:hypothetical protein
MRQTTPQASATARERGPTVVPQTPLGAQCAGETGIPLHRSIPLHNAVTRYYSHAAAAAGLNDAGFCRLNSAFQWRGFNHIGIM